MPCACSSACASSATRSASTATTGTSPPPSSASSRAPADSPSTASSAPSRGAHCSAERTLRRGADDGVPGSVRLDDGADGLAVEGGGEGARGQTVDDLDLLDVLRPAHQ